MELQSNIAYLWKKKIIMILEHIVVAKIQPKPNVVTLSCASWASGIDYDLSTALLLSYSIANRNKEF